MRGGLGVHQFKSLWKLSNGWTDWHHIWYTSVDSSGKRHRLNTIRPSIPQGAFPGGLGGHTFKSLGKLSNGWTDWHQIWYTSAYSSGNGHRLNTIRPSIPQGHFDGFYVVTNSSLGKLPNGGSTIQKTGKCGQTAGPMGNQFRFIGPMRHQGEDFHAGLRRVNFGGFEGVNISSKVGECHDLQRKQIKINFLKIKCTIRYNYDATIPGEAGYSGYM